MELKVFITDRYAEVDAIGLAVLFVVIEVDDRRAGRPPILDRVPLGVAAPKEA